MHLGHPAQESDQPQQRLEVRVHPGTKGVNVDAHLDAALAALEPEDDRDVMERGVMDERESLRCALASHAARDSAKPLEGVLRCRARCTAGAPWLLGG